MKPTLDDLGKGKTPSPSDLHQVLLGINSKDATLAKIETHSAALRDATLVVDQGVPAITWQDSSASLRPKGTPSGAESATRSSRRSSTTC